tara:strand:- start:9321 stop:11201 length:1881 start_codon:yes stop_codon:yes gene_type:complete
MNKAELRKYLEDNARREMAGLRPKFFLGIGSSLKRKYKRAEDKAKDVVGDVVDFVDEDILDPAGEFLEEEILDPAGEFLGEEIAQPLRRQISQAMPKELGFLGNIAGAAGGGKIGALIAGLMTGNPYLIALGAGIGASAGDVAGDYLTTDENEEFDPNLLSAAVSGISAGIGSLPGKAPVTGTDALTGQTVDPSAVGTRRMLQPGAPGTAPTYAYEGITDAAALADAGVTASEAAAYADALNAGDLIVGAKGAGEGLKFTEGLKNIADAAVTGAQPYTDPFELYGQEAGTVGDIIRTSSGRAGFDVAKDLGSAALKATAIPGAKAVAQMGLDYYEALEKAEEDYREYLRQRGLRADQIQSQNRTLRRQYYNQSFQNRGYSSEEIAEILLRAKLIDSIEDYDPTDLPEGRKFGEDVTDDTVYAAKGGRIGFQDGTNMLMQDTLGIGDYARKSMMEENLDNFEPMPLPSPTYMGEPVQMPGRPPMTPMPMPGPTYGRPPMAMPDKMTLVEDYMDRLNNMTMGGGRDMGMAKGGIMRSKNAMGTRRTPEGDPISPDVPPGMQMDLRGGGFIPLGTKPRADDVPAMVGKDEFVLNDRAVAGIGKLLTGRPDARAGARALYKLQNEMEASV